MSDDGEKIAAAISSSTGQRAAAGPSSAGKLPPEERALWDIDFAVKKSIRYHARRRAFFERLDNASNVLVAIAGASAFAALMGDPAGRASKILTFVVTAIALADVLLAFGPRARAHADLYRRFSELAVEIAQLEHPSGVDISRLRAKRLMLEADEPHIIDALERVCWNEEAEARGTSSDHLQHLSLGQRLRARLAS